MKTVLTVVGAVTVFGVIVLLVMWVTNYLFSSTFLTFVFGGALTYWKAFWFSMFMGGMVKSTSSSKG